MKKALFPLFAAAFAAALPARAITGSGTEADPFVIASDADWAAFADTNNAAAYWAGGVHVRLDADVSASTRIGGPTFVGYAGVFDGGGHTATMDGTAPFSSLAGATVRNLRIAGTVVGGNHAGGLTSGFKDGGPNLIENCAVTADITGNRSAGGFVGNGGGDTATVSATLRGCVFAGTIETTNAPNRVGTFWGWSGNLASVKLEDCFDASDLTDPIGLGWGTIVVTNVYYAKAGKTAGDERAWPEAKRGARVRSVALGEGVSVAGPTNEYATAGVAFVGGSVVRYGDGLFCAPGNSFELRGPSGLRGVFAVEDGDGDDVTADVLAGSTITMPDADVTVSFVQLLSDGDVLTGEGRWPVAVEDGATVTLRDFSVNPSGPDVIGPGVRCLGDATVALEGTNVLRGFFHEYPGLQAGPDGTTLRILGPGALVADSNGYAPGIGGTRYGDCGNISIAGGTVTATGGYDGTGIGSGLGGHCGDISISGGTVTAMGGESAPGIGSGVIGRCGDISISGGTVTATGGTDSPGIGAGKSGNCGNIEFSGGVTTATGGRSAPAIGSGDNGNCYDVTLSNTVTRVTAVAGSALPPCCIGAGSSGTCGSVTVGGTAVHGYIVTSPYVYEPSDAVFAVSFDANGGEGSMAGQTFLSGIPQNLATNEFRFDGKVFLGWSDAADGSGAFFLDGQSFVAVSNTTLYAQWNDFDATLTERTGRMRLVDGQSLAGTAGTNAHVVVAAGATVTLRGVTILGVDDPDRPWAAVTCEGDATIVLEGTNVLRGFYSEYPGLHAGPRGTTLRILGPGSLTADSNGYAPGVGGGYYIDCGDISVSGGKIVAVGGFGAAGLGGASSSSCGTVSVSGGTVFAWGGSDAPGVGNGAWSSCDGVAISGGAVSARGGDGAPGIECSNESGGDVDIADGVSAVLAASGYDGSDAISAAGRTMVGGGLEDSEAGGVRVLYPRALSVGENAVAFGKDGKHVRIFVPTEAGWYRFRIPRKASATTLNDSDPIFTVDYAAGGSENFYPDYAPGYDLDDFVWLEDGDRCTVRLGSTCAPDLRPLAVERVAAHAVSVDGGTTNGRIDTGIAEYFSPAPEGRFVPLTAEADEGFAVGEWIVTNAAGNRLTVVPGDNCSSMGFFMPGSDVTVSASFGKPLEIDVHGDPRVYCEGAKVNGSTPMDFPVAAPGAFVEVCYHPTQYGLWTLLPAGVATTNGEPVACTVRELGTEEVVLSFTMPGEPVVVVPAFGNRSSYPALREDCNELVTADPNGTMRSFVPTVSGRYMFRPEHGGFTSPTLFTADGILLDDKVEGEGPDGNGMSRTSMVVELVAGQEYLVWFGSGRDDIAIIVPSVLFGDNLLHDVFVVPADGGTVEVSVSRAFPGHPVAIRAVPDPGYELVGIEAYCESGDSPSVIDEWYSPCPYIMMPDEDVTVAAEFRPVYPDYLESADDFVKANYLAWAARYGKADTDGTHEDAFLLDVDPAAPLGGRTLLEISDFAVTPTNLLLEIASDATDLVKKTGPDDGYVNNGILVIQTSTEPDPQTFLSGSPWPVSGKAGRILVEMPVPPDNVPDKAFFRAKLVPAPDGSVFGP